MTAILLTWKESGWPHENIVRMVNEIDANGHVDEPWRIAAHKIAKPGDRVWVLKQGRGPRGVFGVGEITGPPARGDAGNEKIQWMAAPSFLWFASIQGIERTGSGRLGAKGLLHSGSGGRGRSWAD
jgi:hypothetical protein